MKLFPSRKAQIEVTVNWIYILIAGAVILLFFVSIIVQQKAKSERELSEEVLQLLQSIFSGAAVSEKTKNSLEASGLNEFTLYFSCTGDVGEYGIKGTTARVQDRIIPVFAPLEIQAPKLSLWSLPYLLPYKVADFLLLTSDNIKYVLVGDDPFIDEFLNESKFKSEIRFRINAVQASNLNQVDPGENFHIRIVDFIGAVEDSQPVPAGLQQSADEKVSAVQFVSSNSVNYYIKEGALWKKQSAHPIPIISFGGEQDAAKYAAIFAGNGKEYQCNMRKAFQRLIYLNEVYGGARVHLAEPGGKLGELVAYYEENYEENPSPENTRSQCRGHIYSYGDNLVVALLNHQNAAKTCLLRESSCPALITTAQKLQQLNEQLRVDCLTLY